MSAFLKQVESRAKIISKVIRQPYPDSLTQTTMSANTDRAQSSESSADVICREELEGSAKWLTKTSHSFTQSIKESYILQRHLQKPLNPRLRFLQMAFVPLEETTDPLKLAFFGKRRSIRTHQVPAPRPMVSTCLCRGLWLKTSLHHFPSSVYIHFVSPQTSHITRLLNIRDSSARSQWCIHGPASPPSDCFL